MSSEACGARTSGGTPCQQPAGFGTGHIGVGRCKWHGGSTPNAELGGALVLARREAAVMGQPLAIAPEEAIMQCIHIAAGEVAYAGERIADLELDQAVGPVVTTHSRPLKHEKGAESTTERVEEVQTGAPALHIWIRTRREAMDRLVHYSATALKAGVEERRIRVAEQQGALFAQAIRGILADLGLADDPRAPAVVRRHLTLVAGGAGADAS